MVTKAKYDEIVTILRGEAVPPENKEEKIRRYYWLREYKVVDFSGATKVVKQKDYKLAYDAITSELKLDKLPRMAHEDELFDILYRCHIHALGHAAGRRMADHLKSYYNNISRTICNIFTSFCAGCAQSNKRYGKPQAYRPIISETFNSRGQIDLIDMQAAPDGEYKWILQYIDHLTKFCYLRPLKSKSKLLNTLFVNCSCQFVN